MTKRVIILILALTALAGAVFLAKSLKPTRTGVNTAADLGPAPDFNVKIIGGRKVSLQDYKGKPLIINFWASWCRPCRQEAPILVEAAKKYKGRIEWLGIVFQDTPANAKKFEREFKMPYSNAIDPNGAAAANYKITGIPETFFIDAGGRLRSHWIGALDKQTLEKYIEKMIGS